MIQRISKFIPFGLWVGLLVSGSPALALQADVVEELIIRAMARSLMAEPDRPLVSPAEAGDWRQDVALLEAYARAGAPAPAVLVAADPADRVELVAAKLRVLPWMPAAAERFEARLSRGLRSPFSGVRSAALQRLAHWTLEESAMDGRASRLLERELTVGETVLAEGLFRLALRCGDGRRFASLLALPTAAEELERADRGGWDPVLGFFEDIVAVPLSVDEVTALGRVSKAPGGLACVQLVAHVRDQLAVVAPKPAPILAVLAASPPGMDGGEIDAVAEALVAALSTGSGEALPTADDSGVHEAVLELGVALLGAAARAELDEDARERCLRTSARLLPVEDLLSLGQSLNESAALVMWDTLDRRDDWLRGTRLVQGLAPWVGHRSDAVREAAVRAVGRRYAYSERSDLEGALVAALSDEDATVRSLSFAWLAKSERPEGAAAASTALDDELFAAWEGEGHGGESPTLTERQGRWLAQLPRDRQAVLYRGALLGLLSLEGSSQEAVGAGSVELLSGFRGDAEVFQRVAILLERSLVGIEARPGYPARLPFDSSAARAIRILHSVDSELAEPLVEAALLRSMDRMHGPEARGDARPQLPKTSVGLLARTRSGRGRIAALSARSLPRRVRFEIALQLLKRGAVADGLSGDLAARCARVLMADFDGVDRALRLRAIEALGSRRLKRQSEIESFLADMTGVGNDEAERGKAIEALGRRGNLARLGSVLDAAIEGDGPDAGTIDAAANAARALRLSRVDPAAAARMALTELAKPELIRADDRQLETVRGALLETLSALIVEHEEGAGGDSANWLGENEINALLDAVLEAPMRQAREDAPRQFRSGRRIDTQFLWAAELAALKALSEAPALFRRAIGDVSRWGRLDGRTLLSIARVAQVAGVHDLARELAAGAAVALFGEGTAPDLQRRLAEARWLHAVLASEAGKHRSSARSYRRLLGSYREGVLSRGVLRAMLPGIERSRVSLHGRYWAAVAGVAQGTQVAGRVDAWLRLL